MGEQGAGLSKITCYSATGGEGTLALSRAQDRHLFCWAMLHTLGMYTLKNTVSRASDR